MPGRQTRLYTVMPRYQGETLEDRLKRKAPVSLNEGVGIGLKLGRALYALHRQRIIHRDVKPENVFVCVDGGLRLLDLGASRLPGLEHGQSEDIPGTPSYMAPELFASESGDERSDVFALGVTLYRVFSGGQYPYGEVEAFSTPRFTKRVPLVRYRPDLPAWLDATLARALAPNPAERHGDSMELVLELESHLAQSPTAHRRVRQSLYERNPLRFWKIVSLLLLIALMAALAR
jgi:serine/threonine protein kinase